MLFDETIAQHKNAIEGFLSDPSQSAMILRSPPDIEFLAAKFLAQLRGRDEEPLISFLLQGSFVSPTRFYREVEGKLVELLEDLVDALALNELFVDVPSEVDWDHPPHGSVETRFAEFLEDVARALAGIHPMTVYALRFDAIEPGAEAEAYLSLQRLGSALATSKVKLIVLDAMETSIPQLTSQFRRAATREFTIGNDPLRLLESVREEELSRVFYLNASQSADNRIVDAARMAGNTVRSFAVQVEAEFRGRHQFCQAIYASVLRSVPEVDAGNAPISIYDARALHAPESSLCALLDQFQRDRFGAERELVVAIEPLTLVDAVEWTRFVRGLLDGAAGRRVRYLLVYRSDMQMPTLSEEPWSWRVHEFEMPVANVRAALGSALNDPTTPPSIRIDHLITLGSFYTAEDDQERSVPLLAEAVNLAEKEGSSEQKWSAWWTLGNSLQRGGRFDLSENAYAEAANHALTSQNMGAAAQCFQSMGNARFMLESYDFALQAYELAKEYYAVLGQGFGECHADVWAGEALRMLKRYDEAESRFRSALAFLAERREPFVEIARSASADVAERLARLYDDLKRTDEAAELHRYAADEGCSHGASLTPV